MLAAAFIVGGFFVANSPTFAAGPAAIDLGTASNFVILTRTGITNIPTSHITGNIGTSLDQASTDTAFAGITCGEVVGSVYSFNSTGPLPCVTVDATLVGAAVGDMMTAYTNASSPATPAGVGANNLDVGSGTLSGNDFTPGTYTWNSGVTITNDITLTGGPSDIWIFQVAGTLNIASGKKIILAGGALPQNIFWQVTGAVTLVTGSTFEGNILTQTNVAMQAGATLYGRALAQTAVTLDSNTVSANAPAATCTTICYADAVNGNNANGGTSISDAKKTIQAAITQVNSGGTVHVAAGTYTEQINITKSLTITGAGADTTTIVSPDPATMTIYDAYGSTDSNSPNPRYIVHRGTNIPVVRITASNVSFSDFHVNLNNYTFWNVKGSYGVNYSRGVGILVDHVEETIPGTPDVFTGITIQNNKVDGLLSGDRGDGIKVLGSATATVTGNYLYGGESGINAQAVDSPVRGQYYPTVTANNNTIYSSGPSGGPFGIGFWSGATGSADGNTIYNDPVNDGYALNVWGFRPVSFTNNHVTNLAGIGGLGAQLIESTDLTFTNNRIENQALAGAITHNPTATITGNTITNCTDGFVVDGQTSGAVAMHNNSFSGIATDHYAVKVGGPAGVSSGTDWGTWTGPSTITVDATNNWWGTATSTEIVAKISGNVTFTPWYTNNEMTILSDNTVTNATYSSNVDGQADLPAGATEVTLTDNTVMDLSSSVVATTTEDVTIGGNTVTLTKSVTLQSGIDGDPVVLTNSNSDVAGISASIPDGTEIRGPAGWDGTIMPPISGTPSGGNAPAGFSVGSTVISIGSPDGTLVFDNPVTILLAGVTGAVGYRPSGSNTWIQITNVCGGDYTAPTPPTAPGECAINNGIDTKIVTYHFTSFGSLIATPTPAPTPAPAPSGGGGGALPVSNAYQLWLQQSGQAAPTPTPTPAATPTGQVLGAQKFADGALIRAKGDIDVYIVKYVGDKQFKRLILSPAVFKSYGHLKWENVIEVDKATLDSFTTSNLVRAKGDTKVYELLAKGDTGQKRWIQTAAVFIGLGFDWNAIYEINSVDRNAYLTGSPIANIAQK